MLIEPRVFRWNEKTIEIRSALPEDAKKLKAHREATAAETHFMARYPEDGEIDFGKMRNGIESMRDSQRDYLVTAFLGDEIVGDLGVMLVRPHMKYLHRAYLGMSIRQKCTGIGLGSFMMEIALEQAKKNGFEQVELGVFSDNERAQGLYRKYGFKEYGRTPRAFKLKDGTYRDEIIMVRML